MSGYVALVLVCLSTVPRDACDQKSAVDSMAINVDSELQCMTGWQEIIARSALAPGLGTTSYLKTECRRADRNLK
jgi:hypothetical protein